MSKLYIASIIVFLLFSCKKDYTCSCSTTVFDSGETTVYVTTKTLADFTKSEAIGSCNEAKITIGEGNYVVSTECDLSK